MKSKSRFLDFSNTKEKCGDETLLNVDLIITELLHFGAEKQQKKVKDKPTRITSCKENLLVIDSEASFSNTNSIDTLSSNDCSAADQKPRSNSIPRSQRMVGYTLF